MLVWLRLQIIYQDEYSGMCTYHAEFQIDRGMNFEAALKCLEQEVRLCIYAQHTLNMLGRNSLLACAQCSHFCSQLAQLPLEQVFEGAIMVCGCLLKGAGLATCALTGPVSQASLQLHISTALDKRLSLGENLPRQEP